MKFATLPNGTIDGRLVVVSKDLTKAVDATDIAPNLLSAVQNWQEKATDLQALYDELNAGSLDEAFDFNPSACLAPLPRSPQWLDGSAFINHGKLMEEAFNTQPIPHFETIPIMYQGASDDFQGPTADILMPNEEAGIDFEGEFGVITGLVPMSASPYQAAQAICLLVQINDWSLRSFGPHEMATGFGFIQAKPSSSFAPVAVTPDELGEAWNNGRFHLHLNITWNGERFGEPHGGEMHFSFPELIAHAARTRKLNPGSIIGSGTVSNKSREAGSACIAERRVIEKIDLGEIKTQFMRFGDTVRMQAKFDDGRDGPFGVIEQKVIANT